MARVVAVLNRKGGTSKTGTCHHLGGTLARRGLRVLLCDVDGQFNLTTGLLGPEVAESLDARETIAAILDDGAAVSPRELVRATAFPNLSILPGSEAAEQYNVPSPWETGLRQYALRDALAEAATDSDIVLIDCPPHIQFWAWSALVAADGVVVPLQAEDHGALGMKAIRRVIARVQDEANPNLALVGYLITMFNKSLGVHVTYENYLRQQYGAEVFSAVVPLAKDFKEAVTFRKPIVEYKPRSAAAKAIAALADEFLARLDERCGAAADESRRVA
jgi:chromosome partitioning protein